MTLPHIGLPADEVLKMKGRGKRYAIAEPTVVSKDDNGVILAWHYADCDVLLHYHLGCYRVKEVLRVEG